ncbi:MAG: Ribosome-recycling factor [Lentisphaerae bacterium ADurb.BinA184]|nr:MAG: Ribosome-recycling factor [Lentisphaerae bacterium ADurb.BinA184]
MDMNIKTLEKTTQGRMEAAVKAMQDSFAAVRTGKASPALVENIMVECYGSSMRLRDVAGITAPEPRLLVIQPWDQGVLGSIEKAIQASNIGISPVSDGRVIRLPIPELSEERRNEMTKLVKTRAEDARVEVRNVRREANDFARKSQKDGKITEDELDAMQKRIQKMTDDTMDRIGKVLEQKAKELMQV